MKISDFRYALGTENEILCYKERHPLMMKSFITFPSIVRKIGGLSDRIYKPLKCKFVLCLPKLTLKFHIKC